MDLSTVVSSEYYILILIQISVKLNSVRSCSSLTFHNVKKSFYYVDNLFKTSQPCLCLLHIVFDKLRGV